MDLWISYRYFQCECGETMIEPLDTLQNGTTTKLLSTPESTWCPKNFLLEIKRDICSDLNLFERGLLCFF